LALFSLSLGGFLFADQTIELTAPDYHIRYAEGFHKITIDGYFSYGVPGYPDLPCKIFQVALPPGVDIRSIDVTYTERSAVHLGRHQIKELPPMTAWDGQKQVFARMESTYSKDMYFPEKSVEYTTFSKMRKWNIANIKFTPFQYNPVTGDLRFISGVAVHIVYREVGKSGVSDKELADTVMDERAQGMLLNYKEARNWYEPSQPLPRPSVTYDYVIITTSAIQSACYQSLNVDFVTYLKNRSYSPLIVTEGAFAGLTGQYPNGTADKIRKWLQDHYLSYGIKYILLIGNPDPDDPEQAGDSVGDIPTKYLAYRGSDYYFADLTGNWDLDGDGIFGEYDGDRGAGGVDFVNECYVGRIPYYSAADNLVSVLAKFINYGTSSDILWRRSALLPASFMGPDTDGAYWAEAMISGYLTGAGFSNWKMYQQGSAYAAADSAFASDEELRDGKAVLRWSSNDFGMVWWNGHGNTTIAAIGWDGCWDGRIIQSSDVTSLDDSHPSFVFQSSCLTGQTEVSNNLGKSLLYNGAISTVCTNYTSWVAGGIWTTALKYYCDDRSIGYYYGQQLVKNNKTAGEALFDVKSEMGVNGGLWGLDSWKNLCGYNLYGDPLASLYYAYVPPSVTVTSPNGGEIWAPSSVHNITWTTTGAVSDVTIFYSTNDGYDWEGVVYSTSGNSYSWTVPSTPSTQCRIMVARQSNWDIQDMSDDPFTIFGGTVFLPTVGINQVSEIGGMSAMTSGAVSADGGAAVTARGVCWSTSLHPTLSNSHTYDGTGTGYFSSHMTGLLPDTLYYVRGYATNSAGTSYGNELSFWTVACSGLPFSEYFYPGPWPSGWVQNNMGPGITNLWSYSDSNQAGGDPYEMKCQWSYANPGYSRLVTPPINTLGYSVLNLKFKHFLDTFSPGGLILAIQTSTDGITWTDEAWQVTTSSSNLGPETISTSLTHNLNSAATYVGFVISGNLYYFDFWYIDDISIEQSSFSLFKHAGSWTDAGHGTDGWYVGDYNGDGRDDIFRYSPGISGAQVFLSGETKFVTAGSWTGAGHGTDGWYIGDFNGDGRDDIFRYVAGVSGAQVFLSDGKKFVAAGSWTGAGHGTDGWYVGDYNGDGRDDIFRYLPGVSGAQVFLSDGTKFALSGSWTGAGHGTDGWYIGDFNGDWRDDIFRYLPGVSGAQVFLSDGTKFALSGSWTGAGHGDDGWYIGDFNGDGADDIFRYVQGVSGADVFLAAGTAGSMAARISAADTTAMDEDMMLDVNGARQTELSFDEEAALLAPFTARMMAGEEVSIYEIKSTYEQKAGRIVRLVEVRQMLHRHGFWDIEGQVGRGKEGGKGR
jgi:hypothetical protein